jgi:hypothetical protein
VGDAPPPGQAGLSLPPASRGEGGGGAPAPDPPGRPLCPSPAGARDPTPHPTPHAPLTLPSPRLASLFFSLPPGATLFSFCLAAAFFLSEALAFGTVSLRAAANPLAIAAFSAAWMGGGWSYYTRHAAPGGGNGVGGGGAGGPGGRGGAPPSSAAYPEASEDVETESVSKFD